MDKQDGNQTKTSEELRCFTRVTFPASTEMSVELGTLGTPPSESVPINISRGGLQTRIGATMFNGGDEILIRLRTPRDVWCPTGRSGGCAAWRRAAATS